MVRLFNDLKNLHIMMVSLLCLLTTVETKAMESTVCVNMCGAGVNNKSYLVEVPYSATTGLVAVSDLYDKTLISFKQPGTIVFRGKRLLRAQSIPKDDLINATKLSYLIDRSSLIAEFR